MIRVFSVYKGNKNYHTTEAYCDECGTGVKWGPNKFSKIPRAYFSKILLREKGWTFGKVHKCGKCNHSPKE